MLQLLSEIYYPITPFHGFRVMTYKDHSTAVFIEKSVSYTHLQKTSGDAQPEVFCIDAG